MRARCYPELLANLLSMSISRFTGRLDFYETQLERYTKALTEAAEKTRSSALSPG
jgi:hypothetical protein